ncbi:MAG: BppU family phage baseplate upper protein [Clostridium perfringens]|uniref:BppU family phage baseplate upper protein n=1 Tax=Clostridium perfringens TaxID=1502 RepID=UPI00096AB2C9|nr:BppU family phage baseplate upper protein [Clostridium perfringens]
MDYTRRQKSLSPIDIYGVKTVDTGAIFKQYDINTSILEVKLIANGEPVILTDEEVYVTVNSSVEINTNQIKYSKNYKCKCELIEEKLNVRRNMGDNLLEIILSEKVLNNAGDMIAEIVIADIEKEQRITSQSFTFKIEPSITPNPKNLNFEKIFEKGDDK